MVPPPTFSSTPEWLDHMYQELHCNESCLEMANKVFAEDEKFFPQVFRAKGEGLFGAATQISGVIVENVVTPEVFPLLERLFSRFRPLADGKADPRLRFVNWILAKKLITIELNSSHIQINHDGRRPLQLPVQQLENHDLPVTFLPLFNVLGTDGPPEFAGGIPPQEEDHCNISISDKCLKVFVSHRWAECEQPSHPEEWQAMLKFFTQLINDTILACWSLVRSGFPLGQWLCSLDNEKRQQLSMGFAHGVTVTLPSDERIKVDKQLACAILLMSAEEVSMLIGIGPDHCNEFTTIFELCSESISKRILLWYDYSCLPQNLNDKVRSPEEDRLFKQTLDLLPQVQLSMHTLLLDFDDNYRKRAWCVAEWMTSAPIDCSQWRQNGPLGYWPQAEITWMNKQCEVLEYLLDPTTSSTNILGHLNLEFTDVQHMEFGDRICWLFWNAVMSRMVPPTWTKQLKNKRITVGSGCREGVIQWLRYMEEALNRSPRDPLTYSRESWQSLRSQALEYCASSSSDGGEDTRSIEIIENILLDPTGLNMVDRLAQVFIELVARVTTWPAEEQDYFHVQILVHGEEQHGWGRRYT